MWPHPNDRLLSLSPPGLLIIWDFQVSHLERTVSKKEFQVFPTKPMSVLIFQVKSTTSSALLHLHQEQTGWGQCARLVGSHSGPARSPCSGCRSLRMLESLGLKE